LGYDVDPQRFRLLVNAEEAERVRTIFKLYLEHESLLPVVLELERRAWLNKRWTTRKGRERGGKTFTRTSLHKLLTNVAYTGKVRYKNEVHDGEHAAIVDPVIWQRVQALLERNGRTGGAPVRNKFGALLKGIIRCVPCDSAMTPTHTTRGESRRYRYYVCCSAQKLGWHTCASKSVPAVQIEELVVRQIKAIGGDPRLLAEILEQARQQDAARAAELLAEQRELQKELTAWHGEMQSLTGRIRPGDDNGSLTARLADLQERIGVVEGRMRKIREQIHVIHHQLLEEDEAALAMSIFDPVWEAADHVDRS
jgi:site-specific DNA recombinase